MNAGYQVLQTLKYEAEQRPRWDGRRAQRERQLRRGRQAAELEQWPVEIEIIEEDENADRTTTATA